MVEGNKKVIWSGVTTLELAKAVEEIFYMEAGNGCFDENLLEETNCHIVDHILDVITLWGGTGKGRRSNLAIAGKMNLLSLFHGILPSHC